VKTTFMNSLKNNRIQLFIALFLTISSISGNLTAQSRTESDRLLTDKQQGIVPVAAYTAIGDLQRLKSALNEGLDAGLTINEIKEVIVHLYAYCGFPRSIRGLQTFMEVLDERKARGIQDVWGADASPVQSEHTKYERGRAVLAELTKSPQDGPLTGYRAFAPVIDTLLKEHLFVDLFERDVLTYAERELVTVTVLSTIGGVEPMLRSHFSICLNVGLTAGQLYDFVGIIESTLGKKEADAAQHILNEVLLSRE
jgi:4-carboxymuconolactone decarboxylase